MQTQCSFQHTLTELAHGSSNAATFAANPNECRNWDIGFSGDFKLAKHLILGFC